MPSNLFEMTVSPEMLLDPTIDVKRMTLLGLRLGDPANQVDISLVEDASSKKVPAGFATQVFSWEKDDICETYLLRDKEDIRKRDKWILWSLEERIPFVLEHGGSLQFKDEYSYGIEDGSIVSFHAHLKR